MSSLADITRRVGRLQEISSIMTAMRNLSLVETRKLARFIGHQRRMLANIETALADFLHFHPQGGDSAGPATSILVLVGAERGFCGAFNERILAALESTPGLTNPGLIVVGQRLSTRLDERGNVLARIEGPTVTEDVPFVLVRLMDALHAASAGTPARVALWSLAHAQTGEPEQKRLLPAPVAAAQPAAFSHAPQILVPPLALFAGLLDQYLLAALNGLLYESLAAESRQRLAHMENALDRLGETVNALAKKRNALRQEKIIEEIEVMLANRTAFGAATGNGFDTPATFP